MERYPVLFRCDADQSRGWGHLYACMTYAAALQRRRRTGYFYGNLSPFPLLAALTRAGNEYLPAAHPVGSPEDCDATLRAIRKHQVAAVVLAGDDLPVDYVREVSASGVMTVVLDSQAGYRFPSKLVINPLLGPTRSAYECERGTQLLIGARYATVRPIFRRQRALRSMEPPTPYRVLVAAGDDDLGGEALKRTRELLNTPGIDKVSVAIRNHHPQYDQVRELSRLVGNRVEVLTEINELATRLLRVHFAVTSGDAWSLEMACTGIPQLILSQNPAQAANAKELDAQGAATWLGDSRAVTARTMRDAVENLLGDPLERKGMSRCAKKLIDGRGLDRIVNALEVLLPARRRAVVSAKIAA